MPAGQAGTFGGVMGWAAVNTPVALKAIGKYGLHTTFVCGVPKVDAENGLINIAYSTENLLLNAYRQGRYGYPSIVQIDTTHRLVLEGHSCLLIGTVDPAQHFHIIGYGIMSDETQQSHQYIVEQLKIEVESIVAERKRSQTPI